MHAARASKSLVFFFFFWEGKAKIGEEKDEKGVFFSTTVHTATGCSERGSVCTDRHLARYVLVLVEVNVEPAFRHFCSLRLRCKDLQLACRRHLGPNQRHLCTQPKPSACLLDAILCARQHPPKHIRDVVVPHAFAPEQCRVL